MDPIHNDPDPHHNDPDPHNNDLDPHHIDPDPHHIDPNPHHNIPGLPKILTGGRTTIRVSFFVLVFPKNKYKKMVF